MRFEYHFDFALCAPIVTPDAWSHVPPNAHGVRGDTHFFNFAGSGKTAETKPVRCFLPFSSDTETWYQGSGFGPLRDLAIYIGRVRHHCVIFMRKCVNPTHSGDLGASRTGYFRAKYGLVLLMLFESLLTMAQSVNQKLLGLWCHIFRFLVLNWFIPYET